MAKKVAVPENGEQEPIKKKRSKCCTCCLVFVTVLIVIFAAAFGIGWYFGDKFTKENFGMSLYDTFGVLNDLYWTDDADVVKNPYSKNDINGFYTEIKRNMLLRDDADIDFDAALNVALEKYLNNGSDGEDGAEQQQAESDGETASEEGGSSVIDLFVDMIAEIMTRDNVDMDRINAYDENNAETDEYIFNLNDKQFAAFMSAVLNSVLKQAGKTASFGDVSVMIDLPKVVSLKQISFKATTKTEDDAVVVVSTTADMTIWLGLQDAVGQALKYYMKDAGYGWASGIAGFFGNVILPENLYLTVSVPLYGDVKPQIVINDMNDKERARANKLINGIIKMSGGSQTLDGMLEEYIDEVKPYLEKIADKMSFENASKGTLTFDMLEMMTGLASKDGEGDPLTKSDFIYLLKALLSDQGAYFKAIQPYRYQNRYLDADGKEVYIAEGSTELTPVSYKKKFIEAIADAYMLDIEDDGKDNDASLTDILGMLGISMDGSSASADPKELLKLMNAQKFNDSLTVEDLSTLELRVTDRMLAAALSEQMGSFLTGSGSSFENLRIALDALTFTKKADKPDNMYAMIAVEVYMEDLLERFGASNVMGRIAQRLMPEKVMMTITVDITRNRAAGEQPDPTEFIINTCDDTDRALDTLEKMIPGFDLKTLAEKTESMLNDMLDQMYKKLNVTLVASAVEYDSEKDEYTGETGKLILPDIFTVVAQTVLVDDDGNSVVEPKQLQDVLYNINNANVTIDNPVASDGDYSDFIAQVVDKYYLDPTENDDVTTFDGLTGFMGDFDTGKFRISGEDPSVNYLAYDGRDIDELKPLMRADELGALLRDRLETNTTVEGFTVAEVTTAAETLDSSQSLTVVLSISVGNLLDDVGYLITAKDLYVTATAYIDPEQVEFDGDRPRYRVDYKLNNMSETTLGHTLDIVKLFKPDFDIEEKVNEFGAVLYEQLANLENSISFKTDNIVGGDTEGSEAPDVPVTSDNGTLFRLTDDGLEMIDFYTFLANKMKLALDGATTPSMLQATLQGMYERSTVKELENTNNYLRSDIMFNEPESKDLWNKEQTDAFMSGTPCSDIAFNGFLMSVESIDTEKKVHMEQTVILSNGDRSDAAKAARKWVNDSGTTENPLDETGDYMLVTFSMTMNKYMDTGNSDATGFYPDVVYATIVYEKHADSSFEQIGLIFNDMSSAQYQVLLKLMDFSEDSQDPKKVNIVSISGKSATVLDGLTSGGAITFGGRLDDEGIGSIKYSANMPSL